MSDAIVLCYHAVSPTWPAALSVTPMSFERQMELLARGGWTAQTFSELVQRPRGRRRVAITFDDAFLSVKRHALPILEHHGFPATVFAPTDYVTTGRHLGWEGVEHWLSTEHADELAPMSWDDLRELAGRGWEIGSHTLDHPRLTRLDHDALMRQLAESREACSRAMSAACPTLAYPYGDVDPRVAEAAAQAGYDCAAGLSSSLAHLGPYRWPRVGIYNADTPSRFRLKLARPMRRLRASSLWSRRPSR